MVLLKTANEIENCRIMKMIMFNNHGLEDICLITTPQLTSGKLKAAKVELKIEEL